MPHARNRDGTSRKCPGEGGESGRIVHLNFEDERIKSVSVDELHLIAEAHAELFPEFARAKCWYFLDELQNVEGWETYALKR